MKLAHCLLNETIKLNNEEKVNILVIENQQFFTDMLTDLNTQVNKLRGEFVLSINNVPVEISKHLEIITEFIAFEINKKTLINRLLKKADYIAQNEDFILKTKELYFNVGSYAQLLADVIDYNIEFLCEWDISSILKAIDFRFKDDYMTISEKIIEYMLIVREFENEKCFLLVNLRNYINDREIESFYKTVLYNKLNVLVLSAKDYPLSKFEKKTIVDKDLCEF